MHKVCGNLSVLCPSLDTFLTQHGGPRSRMSELFSLTIDGFHRDMNRKIPHSKVQGAGGGRGAGGGAGALVYIPC